MFSKWKVKGLEGFVFDENGKLYRLPYKRDKRSYEIREVKKQYPNRYKINGEWWSQRQLKPLLYLDENPVELFKEKNLPF